MERSVTPRRESRSRQFFARARYTFRPEPIMSSRKKKSASSASSLPDGALVDGGGHAPSHVPRRVWVLATLDALFAALYIGVTRLVASADGRFEALTIVMGVAILAAGVGLASR